MTLPHFVDKIIIVTLLIVCQEKNDILQNIFIESFYQDQIFFQTYSPIRISGWSESKIAARFRAVPNSCKLE